MTNKIIFTFRNSFLIPHKSKSTLIHPHILYLISNKSPNYSTYNGVRKSYNKKGF